MEKYKLANGEEDDIIRFSDNCVVAKNRSIVYSGSYAECRKYIEAMREVVRKV